DLPAHERDLARECRELLKRAVVEVECEPAKPPLERHREGIRECLLEELGLERAVQGLGARLGDGFRGLLAYRSENVKHRPPSLLLSSLPPFRPHSGIDSLRFLVEKY